MKLSTMFPHETT